MTQQDTPLVNGLSTGKQGRARQWTAADDKLIRAAYQGYIKMKDLAQILKASLPTIYLRMADLGLPLRNKPKPYRDVMRLRARRLSRTTPTAQAGVSKR